MLIITIIVGEPSRAQAVQQDSNQETINIGWTHTLAGTGTKTYPALAYNPVANEIFLAFADGRNDPQNRVDYYGFEANSDIFAQIFSATGQPKGSELTIANDGQKPANSGRYDNEQWPATVFSPAKNQYTIAWMTLPDSALAAGDLQTTSCYDVDSRNFKNSTLTSTVLDLASYTPPASLISPWGNKYDWSCQQEPELGLDDVGNAIAIWQDHRERFAQTDGVEVSKDIYLQLINNTNKLLDSSFLISRNSNNQRVARHQENPDIASNIDHKQHLIVWKDERRSSQIESQGFRDITGRLIATNNGVVVLGKEISIARGALNAQPPGSTDKPRVAYLSSANVFVAVWSKVDNYLDTKNSSFELEYALIDLQGNVLKTSSIANSNSKNLHLHDLDCGPSTCLLSYRKGNDTRTLYTNTLSASDYLFDNEKVLDNQSLHHSFLKVVTGNSIANETKYYVAYTVGSKVQLSQVGVMSEAIATATPTIAATPTTSPTQTAAPTPTPTKLPGCNKSTDINQDKIVDLYDLSVVVEQFFKTGINLDSDLNCDRVVDLLDYSMVVTDFHL